MIALIPVLLFGTKYVLDWQTANQDQLMKNSSEYYKDPSDYYKNCAREVALAVAKKWNPGLSFYQQREAMYKVADDEYNKYPTYSYSTPVYTAVPGMDLPTDRTVIKGGTYIPLKVNYSNYQNLDPSLRTVEYTEETNLNVRTSGGTVATSYACYIFSLFNTIYNFDNRDSALVLNDTIWRYALVSGNRTKVATRTTNKSRINTSGIPYAGFSDTVGQDNNSSKVYRRKALDDDKVKIEIINDQIKVTTDGNYVGYAVPATCNVDIVLGIPVNRAASNKSNLDNNSSPTAGSPYTSTSTMPTTDGLSTPISQIGTAFHDFVKKFHYTRGVNVGIVPYCGMVSLPLDRIETWATDPENFNRTIFPGNQNTYQGYIRPCMFYGLFGNSSTLGSFVSHSGIKTYSLTNVMVPQGRIEAVERYGNNLIYCGDILSTNDPAGDVEEKEGYLYSPKFMRRPVYKIPGFTGKFNFLSMSFESTSGGGWTWCNPYHIVEMQSDLLKITDLLNLFYPFNFASNGLSNFIFVPFVWANNLFRSWSNDPSHDSENTSDAKLSTMTNETSGRLSTPSKTTSGRKKALILVVNKPDWFEPGELTYLGYDNDFSEIPMIESDCIRGDMDYTDTNKYFADGTKYDGTVQGAKKILKLTGFTRNSTTGHYECASGTATLSFPQKYLVKLVVEGKVTWTNAGKQYTPLETTKTRKLGQGTISWDGTKFLFGTNDSSGKVLTSTDGKNWTATATNLSSVSIQVRPVYGDGLWLYISGYEQTPSYTSTDGVNWTNKIASTWRCDAQAYGNGGFMHFGVADDHRNIAYWLNPSDLTNLLNNGNFKSIEDNIHRALGFCNGKWCAITWDGRFIVSYDNGANWAVESRSGASPGDVTGTTSEWYGVVYGFGRYWAICRGSNNTGNTSRMVFSRDGKTWRKADAALGTICGTTGWFRGLGFNGTRFVSASDDGYFAYGDCNASITFTNILNGMVNNDTTYKVTEKKEFFIEPSQISNTQTNGNYTITFNATNLRLISAEITNRPYVKVTPTVSKSGNVFTLNAKVPFAVPIRVSGGSGKITYTTAASGSSAYELFLHSQSFQATPEKVQYKKTFDSNSNPVYKVTLTPTIVTFGTPQVGTVESQKVSVSGLSLDSSSTNLSGSLSNDGVTFNYSMTKPTDTTGTATVSNGTITCPTGSVLHVKALPGGNITFHNNNNIEDNVGTKNFTKLTKYTFSGGQDPSSDGGHLSTRGVNFGHNLSLYKVRYSLNNSKIIHANLKDQWIRDYEGQYGRNHSDYKRLILSDGTLATKNSTSYHYSVYSTYGLSGTYTSGTTFNSIVDTYLPKFRDPCYSVWNILKVQNLNCCGTEYQNTLGRENDYYCRAYGVEGNSTFYHQGRGIYIWVYLDQNTAPTIDGANVDSDIWVHLDVNLQLNQDFSFNRGNGDGQTDYVLQTYVKNGVEKNLLSQELKSSIPSTLNQNDGIYLVNLSSKLSDQIVAGNYICFNGDGELSVFVSPYGTITFNCENENLTKHELYKENNFCLEPSQMTDNGDGTQSVTFTTTGNVTVTATYEMKQQTQLTVTKPSNVAFATINVTGHKKEMKWKTASVSPADLDSSNIPAYSSKSIEYDGTNCYMAGKTGLYKSTDLGDTWTHVAYQGSNNTYSKLCYGKGLFLWMNDYGKMYIWPSDLSPSFVDMTLNTNLADLYGSHYCWAGASYADGYFLSIMCDGEIYKSVNGYDWTFIGQEGTLVNDSSYTHGIGFNSGCVFINGTWYAATIQTSNMLPIICSSDGENWTTAVIASSTVASGLYTLISDGKSTVFITYGSNRYMFISNNGKLVTGDGISANSNYVNHGNKITNDIGSTTLSGLSYANGVFLVKSVNGLVAYCTFHDGVMWSGTGSSAREFGISRDINQNISAVINTETSSNVVNCSNMTITGISVTYDKIIPLNPSTVIEYKKIRLPEHTGYIDYSTNLYTTYIATELASGAFLSSSHGWSYDVSKGFFVNNDNAGYYTQIYVNVPVGDHTSLTYSDDVWEMRQFSADGFIDSTYKMNQYDTSGLTRAYTTFKNFVRGTDRNWNDYMNGAPGSISLIMQTMTLPINAALWSGASGDSLHNYKWQSDKNESEEWVWNNLDATEAVKEVTKKACAKLKTDYENNLRVYLIKFRKQTQYKHPVTQTATDFDYSYLNNCATSTSSPYMYDITTEADLKSALDAIYTNISSWATRTEAKNV